MRSYTVISRRTTRVLGLSLAAVTTGSALAATVATAAPVRPSKPSNSPTSAYKLRTSHKVGKNWTVKVTSINKNANAACKKADDFFYQKPKKGYTYVVVQYSGKKLSGGHKESIGDGIETNLYAKDHKQYGALFNGIVAPHDASESKPVKKGGTSSGGFTYEVKNSDIKAGHLEAIIEDNSTITPYFFKT
jgi:hypothetical protein